jgi:hypothetical protein
MNNRPNAKITGNGFVKFFKPDGTPNEQHPSSFYRQGDESILIKEGYHVIHDYAVLKSSFCLHNN